eukprot:TRINITY_DN13256_c0_g1_i4.p1 TRINITY_DN13256_c0_g1~~TRINITY_DN13256_c0_g1_i4.p1  ORF type:complete len:138 (-),score=19.57 TRINITY_DN13256_c0_g1_i4:258-671(-)
MCIRDSHTPHLAPLQQQRASLQAHLLACLTVHCQLMSCWAEWAQLHGMLLKPLVSQHLLVSSYPLAGSQQALHAVRLDVQPVHIHHRGPRGSDVTQPHCAVTYPHLWIIELAAHREPAGGWVRDSQGKHQWDPCRGA